MYVFENVEDTFISALVTMVIYIHRQISKEPEPNYVEKKLLLNYGRLSLYAFLAKMSQFQAKMGKVLGKKLAVIWLFRNNF